MGAVRFTPLAPATAPFVHLCSPLIVKRQNSKQAGQKELLSGSDNMLDLLEKQKIEILRVIFIDLKKDTKCDLL